jgi:hypothetical protein
VHLWWIYSEHFQNVTVNNVGKIIAHIQKTTKLPKHKLKLLKSVGVSQRGWLSIKGKSYYVKLQKDHYGTDKCAIFIGWNRRVSFPSGIAPRSPRKLVRSPKHSQTNRQDNELQITKLSNGHWYTHALQLLPEKRLQNISGFFLTGHKLNKPLRDNLKHRMHHRYDQVEQFVHEWASISGGIKNCRHTT